jgi:thiamine-phosphate pyrophosphorylase
MRSDLLARRLLLYGVTSRQKSDCTGSVLAQVTASLIDGGVTAVQLREKNISDDAYCALAQMVQHVCRQKSIPFFIDDNVAVACSSGADGVHIGQCDIGVEDARRAIGPDRILGVSVQTVAQAVFAEAAGADYLGAGAVFPTATKTDALYVPGTVLKEICRSVRIPVVAIGGITAENCYTLADTGIAGVAVVSALFYAENPRAAAQRFTRPCEQIRRAYDLGRSSR